MAKQENRPRDRNQLAKFIVDTATDVSKGKAVEKIKDKSKLKVKK